MVDSDAVDQATLGYIEDAHIAQDLLRHVLTQVSGFALMLMTDSRNAATPDASISIARIAADRACDRVRALVAPAAAKHHHHHLRMAAEATQWAFVAAENCAGPGVTEGDRDGLIRALKDACEHLRATARLLPGFEMIDFGHACCATHARAQATARTE